MNAQEFYQNGDLDLDSREEILHFADQFAIAKTTDITRLTMTNFETFLKQCFHEKQIISLGIMESLHNEFKSFVQETNKACGFCGKTEICNGAYPEGCFLENELISVNYVIRLFPSANPCWVASHTDGDPPRTIVYKNAEVFNSVFDANKRIDEVKLTHPGKTFYYRAIPVKK